MKYKKVKQIGVKLSQNELQILDRIRQGKSIAYTIRELIREKEHKSAQDRGL